MTYHVSFTCKPTDSVQRELNDLYDYQMDLGTLVNHRMRLNLFHQLVTSLIDKQIIHQFGTAIDIGCNRGFYAKMISDMGFGHVEGIDVERSYIDKAKSRFAVNGVDKSLSFRVQDAATLDANLKYDLVLCTEVIEHTAEPLAVIEKIKAVLSPGGIAIVSLPNALSLPYLAAYTVKWITGRVDDSLKAHMKYPYFKVLSMFKGPDCRIIKTSATNLFLNTPLIRPIFQTPLFTPICRVNYSLAKAWPLKYFSQFFFLVVQKTGRGGPRSRP